MSPATSPGPSRACCSRTEPGFGTRRGRRALACFAQAVILLRFMRQRAAVADLDRDNAVSLKTAYRYLHEALDVLAAHAPDLPEVVAHSPRTPPD